MEQAQQLLNFTRREGDASVVSLYNEDNKNKTAAGSRGAGGLQQEQKRNAAFVETGAEAGNVHD